ncbi:MAG TPA: hypothetical protein VJ226_12010 [Bradyrhizobium sp.]|nr:hypothetical protein [Bradyrhizobium sp.]
MLEDLVLAAGGSRFVLYLGRAACGLLFTGDACAILAGAVAVIDAFACSEEGLPCDPGGIVDSRFLRFGVTARCLSLLDEVAARVAQPCVDLLQFVAVLDLDAAVIETGRPAGRGGVRPVTAPRQPSAAA